MHRADAQDQGFIYGRVTSIDGNQYTGAIRWGKEEVYWFDHFNATKTSNRSIKYLSSSEKRKSSDTDWGNINWTRIDIWSDEYSKVVHQFSCRFGDIESIEITGRDKILLKLKDGTGMELMAGSNDIGTHIKVIDFEIGELKLRWDRVEKIEFLDTPRKLDQKFGTPLYGEVETLENGKFTGYIQWDHDERVGKDKLDGDSRDGKMSISFDKIAEIQREGNRSFVVLKSGRSMAIGGSNDVDNRNRGIVVNMDGKGRVDIPWQQLKKVKFQETRDSGQPYKSYAKPAPLKGKVIDIRDEKFEGIIIFDIDEALDIEMIEGKDEKIEWIIPFRDIRKIQPRNYNYSTVEFKSGDKILIGEKRDVSDHNSGLLIFEDGKKSPTYLRWTKVSEIIFD